MAFVIFVRFVFAKIKVFIHVSPSKKVEVCGFLQYYFAVSEKVSNFAEEKNIIVYFFANSFKCGRFAYIKVKEILTKKSIRYEFSKQV